MSGALLLGSMTGSRVVAEAAAGRATVAVAAGAEAAAGSLEPGALVVGKPMGAAAGAAGGAAAAAAGEGTVAVTVPTDSRWRASRTASQRLASSSKNRSACDVVSIRYGSRHRSGK